MGKLNLYANKVLTESDYESFLQRLRAYGPTETQRYYLNRVQNSEISPEICLKCEHLDISIEQMDRVHFRRKVRNPLYYPDCAGLYVYVNPSAHWSIKIGLLPEISKPQDITQDDLYYKQVKIIPWGDSDEAADLYFRSQGMPYEKLVCEYVWFYTLIQMWKAMRWFAMPTYVGIANSDLWVELISA